MFILSVIVLGLGLMVLLAGVSWFVVNAFRVSVLWGVCVLLFTPAWIRFAIRHWDMASRPLLVAVAGFLLTYGAGHMIPADVEGPLAKIAQPFGGGKAGAEKKEKPALPPIFAAQKEMQLKIKLTSLSQKENDLLERKATIDTKDPKAVDALKAEIVKYNAELQPVLLEMKEREMQSAAR